MKTILLKLTGELLLDGEKNLTSEFITKVASQIKTLKSRYKFGVVIGGGNFFRGNQQGKVLGLTPSVGHYVGMLGTVMNGLILKNIFEKEGLSVSLLSNIICPQIATTTSQYEIDKALKESACIIFAGGTGNPYFSTDTNAIIKGLQIGATEIWKATSVDGAYDSDPKKNKKAVLFKKITYKEAIEKKLEIMDLAAFILAEQEGLKIRVFNAMKDNAIITASQDENFGSLIER